MIGIADVLVFGLHSARRRWLNFPPQFPVGASSNRFDGVLASSDPLLGGSDALSRLAGSVLGIPAWLGTMPTFFSLFVLLVLLRLRGLATSAFVLGLTGVYRILEQSRDGLRSR